MAEEEERVLEEQLEVQLQGQKHSVSAIKHALIFDPDNAELLSFEEELISSIKDAEEGLLGLKRARLFREANAMQGFTKLDNVKSSSEDVLAEHLNPTDVEVETLEEPRSRVGSKCRFRHTDGRWYNGQIVELKDSCSATVSFLTPMSENTMELRCLYLP
ncbi:zinc finger CCCH domain-containing protein 22-like isoform X2 [Silene latifolia]|uniref:zinc finger CCCH domain-containing protein 22-like isoform X2 n=1 Tax=Silene latifolia TaxID=37657 RepID=UPI003D76CF97